eukprot:TRINITY_DN2954_c0_g4_i1.p1 TRINITY_DN2954_c0_g4~~TRINITY_DN2954_c0_g4_i1.p1  ORF type:complete len:690 (+),score=170.98 TRINITY_DN2954_c0_g4_i1:56-2125(+)
MWKTLLVLIATVTILYQSQCVASVEARRDSFLYWDRSEYGLCLSNGYNLDCNVDDDDHLLVFGYYPDPDYGAISGGVIEYVVQDSVEAFYFTRNYQIYRTEIGFGRYEEKEIIEGERYTIDPDTQSLIFIDEFENEKEHGWAVYNTSLDGKREPIVLFEIKADLYDYLEYDIQQVAYDQVYDIIYVGTSVGVYKLNNGNAEVVLTLDGESGYTYGMFADDGYVLLLCDTSVNFVEHSHIYLYDESKNIVHEVIKKPKTQTYPVFRLHDWEFESGMVLWVDREDKYTYLSNLDKETGEFSKSVIVSGSILPPMFLFPSSCSNLCYLGGACNEGNCTCDDKHFGDDCSIYCDEETQCLGGVCDQNGICECGFGFDFVDNQCVKQDVPELISDSGSFEVTLNRTILSDGLKIFEEYVYDLTNNIYQKFIPEFVYANDKIYQDKLGYKYNDTSCYMYKLLGRSIRNTILSVDKNAMITEGTYVIQGHNTTKWVLNDYSYYLVTIDGDTYPLRIESQDEIIEVINFLSYGNQEVEVYLPEVCEKCSENKTYCESPVLPSGYGFGRDDDEDTTPPAPTTDHEQTEETETKNPDNTETQNNDTNSPDNTETKTPDDTNTPDSTKTDSGNTEDNEDESEEEEEDIKPKPGLTTIHKALIGGGAGLLLLAGLGGLGFYLYKKRQGEESAYLLAYDDYE